MMATSRKFRAEMHNFSKKPPAGKQPVAKPATFTHFFVVLVMYGCKKILLVRTTIKLAIYMFGVSAGSLVTDLIPIRKASSSYFADKNNILNQYFVKLGWGWTLSLLLPFVYYTSTTYCCGKKLLVRYHMSRLAIATFWWYVCTKTFNYIENATGLCSSTEMEHYNKKLCKEAGHDWVGFDISGHAFLLMHCLLVISEEVRCVDGWTKLEEIIKVEEQRLTRMTDGQLSTLKYSYENYTPRIKCLIFALTMMQLLWEGMLLSTIIFFHNMPQKTVAGVFAAVVWFVSYRLWYRIENIVPDLSGIGVFRFMNQS